MTEPPNPTVDEMRAFASRHGLNNLTAEQLTRMTELAVYVCALGRSLPRPQRNEDAPASSGGSS